MRLLRGMRLQRGFNCYKPALVCCCMLHKRSLTLFNALFQQGQRPLAIFVLNFQDTQRTVGSKEEVDLLWEVVTLRPMEFHETREVGKIREVQIDGIIVLPLL
jgi:hypothetical protein